MGAVHLTVADLDRSLRFYEDAVGLRTHERSGDRAVLGTGGEDLLVLTELPGAPPARGYCGLFHFALLVPERAGLAGWLAHAAHDQVPLDGLSDHFVSEAIYLSDPDEHGIEIYWDRPRELWEGQVDRRLTTLPLDTDSLLSELADPRREPFEGLAEGTLMGHVHFRVADVAPTVDFYTGTLGLDLMARLGTQATFLSSGGYHHHVGANTWQSAGAQAAPPDVAGLRHATMLLPDAVAVEALAARVQDGGQAPEPLGDGGVLVRDPSGNALALLVGT